MPTSAPLATAAPFDGPLRRDTLGEQIYTLLQRRILDREIAAGRRLAQGPIAAGMGVSRIPVRDALRRLAAEGLVEVYAIRRRLETFAIERAAARIDATTLATFERLLGEMGKAVAAGSADDYVGFNLRFHQTIYEASNATRLTRLIRTCWAGIPTLAPLVLPGRLAHSNAEHHAIVARLRLHDARGAAAALDRHIQNAFDAWMARRGVQPGATPRPGTTRKMERPHGIS
ncbi:MAG: GntR family transcriptional regulator [Acetobacteraceae bacterium]